MITLYLWPIYHDAMQWWLVDKENQVLNRGQHTVQNSQNSGYMSTFSSNATLEDIFKQMTEGRDMMQIIIEIILNNSSHRADCIVWANYDMIATLQQTKISEQSKLSLDELTGLIPGN